jgi:hypothetical protein
MEIWKDINGYDGVYQVSNYGRVRSNGTAVNMTSVKGKRYTVFTKKRILTQSHTVEGYLVVGLTKNGISKQYKVHRLIAEAFIQNPKNKSTINHINGIKDDNRIENLEWCTSKENTQHAHATGLCGINGRSKQVARIDEYGNTVEVFESALQAAKAIGHYSSASNLSKVCRQGRGMWQGMKWKYISLSEYFDFLENRKEISDEQ